ncbi:hypothetical protein CHCC14821_3820 [Bacillus paralicheniformis]|nr:hypothetical protein CHCC14821_3820 [Bacillus paralicheniformis]
MHDKTSETAGAADLESAVFCVRFESCFVNGTPQINESV